MDGVLVVFSPFGVAAFVLALFAVARQLRNDARTDRRLDRCERRIQRYQQRVYQLEAILRAHGVEVPVWTLTPDDIDELDPANPTTRGKNP